MKLDILYATPAVSFEPTLMLRTLLCLKSDYDANYRFVCQAFITSCTGYIDL